MQTLKLDENDKFYDYFNIETVNDVEIIMKDGEKFNGNIEIYEFNKFLKTKGQIINGFREGRWEHYYEDGTLRGVNNYLNGKLEGNTEEYSRSSKLILKGQFLNNKKHGHWYWYYENGNIESEGDYFQNEREGEWLSYYENGQIEKKN